MANYVDLPGTTHFGLKYDDTLNGLDAENLGAALSESVEQDLATVNSWFDDLYGPDVRFTVFLNPPIPGLAGNNSHLTMEIDLYLGATPNVEQARNTFVSEIIEIFMTEQGKGLTRPDGRANSIGEALSRVAGNTLHPDFEDLDLAWLEGFRPDWISRTEPSDTDIQAFSCGEQFIYYMRSQLGFTLEAIVRNAAGTLEAIYHNLTKDSGASQKFGALLTAIPAPVPPTQRFNPPGHNPFPLPTSNRLSALQYLRNDAPGTQLLRRLVISKNVGNVRALLNTDRPNALV